MFNKFLNFWKMHGRMQSQMGMPVSLQSSIVKHQLIRMFSSNIYYLIKYLKASTTVES